MSNEFDLYQCDTKGCEKTATHIVVVLPTEEYAYRNDGEFDWQTSCVEHLVNAKDDLKGQSGGEEVILAGPITKAWHHVPDELVFYERSETELQELTEVKPPKAASAQVTTASKTSTASVDSLKPAGLDLRTKAGKEWLATPEGQAWAAAKEKAL